MKVYAVDDIKTKKKGQILVLSEEYCRIRGQHYKSMAYNIILNIAG